MTRNATIKGMEEKPRATLEDQESSKIYALVCVISQFQEYIDGRGTAAFDYSDRYTATAQQTTTTSSAPSGRRRSAPRPLPSRCDPEEFSEAPTRTITSVLSKPNRSAVKKHVQFPDEQSCVEDPAEDIEDNEEKSCKFFTIYIPISL
ncbi:unnamed protein product [Leptidea sinapis]|uniref:Uncharacterized protein n=1 Tax=Leptidea sinapis TaxID=189913 RepID=A0A5E4PLR6_9NEOP|nr:unnamed protein product [Leptidea sinapis]